MCPLTTITILVYELVKVNPTTRAMPAIRLEERSQACLQKKAGKLLLPTKKNRANNYVTKTGTAGITHTALPNRFAKWKRQQT